MAANALAKCEEQMIEIRGWDGNRVVDAYRYVDFAVHRWGDEDDELWRVTHVPSGLLVAKEFASLEAAAMAMVEIARLRNDWAVLCAEDITHDLFKRVSEIARRHGGYVPNGHRDYRIGLNGYSALVA